MTDPTAAIIMYGTTWCFDSRRARRVFDELEIPYEWIDIDKDSDARQYVEEVNHGFRSVPTIIFPDGSILVEPSDEVLREKLAELTRG